MTVKSADKKPEKYIGPDGKPKIRMVPMDKNVTNEVSADKLGRYIKKRADDLPHAGYMMNDPHSSERRKKGVRDYVKMQKGIKTAVNKLTGKAMVPATNLKAATEANISDLSYDADIHSNGSMKVKKMGKDIHLHGKSYHSSDDHAKVAKKMGMKISSHGKTMGGTRSTLIKASVDEGYRSGHGSGSGTVHGGKHKDPAFQALMKKHGVTHKLVGPKNNKAAKLIGSPDNIRKVLQASYTEDSDAVKAFLAKGGKITKLPPGKAQGYHGKDDPGKHVHGMIAKDAAKNLKLRKHGKHLDTSTPVHKEGVETVKTLVGERPKGLGWGLHSSGQQTGKKHDVWKRTTKKVAAPKFNKEEKGRGPTGIAYPVKKGHPDAENPSTRKKYPERQTPEYKKKFFGKVEKESVEMKTFFQLRESMINEDQAYHKAAIRHHDYHSNSHDTEVRNTDGNEDHRADHDHKMMDHDNASDAHKAAHDAHKKHGGISSQYKAAAKKAHIASKEAHADTPNFHAIDKPTQSKFKLKKMH